MDELTKKQQFLFETINELNRRMIEARTNGNIFMAEQYDDYRKKLNADLHKLINEGAR